MCECDHMPFIDKPALGVINSVKCLYKKEKRTIKKENIWALNHAWKCYLKTWELKPQAARVSVLTHVELWPKAIKLNPL